ncbi:MAG: imidazoleglycerol-phosphate dehydratase HisB [Candidatus Bathyarchaeia archaeon]
MVKVSLNLDGRGQAEVKTGVSFLNHLLGALSKHSLLDLKIVAESRGEPDLHHLVEDTAIVLGQAINSALGEKRGIRRFGSALVPMDEAVAEVALDLSGRGYLVFESDLPSRSMEEIDAEMVRHFLRSLAFNGKFTLHVTKLGGRDYHHVAEALFKALGIALRAASELDPRLGGQVPSQKGAIE